MTDIENIKIKELTVVFDDGTTCTYEEFYQKLLEHLDGRIAGETLTHSDMERFMKRSSSKNLKQLIDGKKAEGYMEGVQDKMLSPKSKITIITIVIIMIVAMIGLVIAKNMGFL